MAEKPRSEEIGLHNLKPKPGSRRPRKRLGRGEGSGLGKTSGRGHKGAGSRSGAKRKAGYEGGQNPIHMRMRKLRGPHMKKSMPFENFRTKTQPVNLSDLEERFEAGDEVNPGDAQGEGPGEARRAGQDPRPRRDRQEARRSTRTRSARPPRRRSRRPAVPVTLWSRNAQDYCERFQRRRHSQEARLHRGDARCSTGSAPTSPRRGWTSNAVKEIQDNFGGSNILGFLNTLLRRQPLAPQPLRAGDHALHHGLDHPAAADRGRPSLERLQKEGEVGQQKITQYTRYLTVGLAFGQSLGYVFLFRSFGNEAGASVRRRS